MTRAPEIGQQVSRQRARQVAGEVHHQQAGSRRVVLTVRSTTIAKPTPPAAQTVTRPRFLSCRFSS